MTLQTFLNALRILHSIDADELESPYWWNKFSHDPSRYFMGCEDKHAQAIWNAMVARGVQDVDRMAPENAADR